MDIAITTHKQSDNHRCERPNLISSLDTAEHWAQDHMDTHVVILSVRVAVLYSSAFGSWQYLLNLLCVQVRHTITPNAAAQSLTFVLTKEMKCSSMRDIGRIKLSDFVANCHSNVQSEWKLGRKWKIAYFALVPLFRTFGVCTRMWWHRCTLFPVTPAMKDLAFKSVFIPFIWRMYVWRNQW